MVRRQIQFSEQQAERLRRMAAERGESVAALVRRAVDRHLAETEREAKVTRALAAVGRFDSGASSNVAEEHDRHLAEIGHDW